MSLPTVVNWIDGGKLAAHRTAGGHRRVAHADLVRYAVERGLSADALPRPTDGPTRVLIVDDEADFADLVRDYLALKAGWQVEVALSGFEAGLAVARFDPDVIVLDLLMPGMDGFAVLRSVAESSQRRVPVVACTGWRDPDLEERVRAAGFDRVVEKPVKMDHLLSVLQGLVRTD